MKISALTAVNFIAATFLFLGVTRGEDWTTTDGKTYKQVSVISHDAGFVVVLDSDGGARIPLRLLPGPVRARFGFDADKAKVAESKALDDDRQNAAALERESQSVQQRQTEESVTENKRAKDKADRQALVASAQQHLVKITQVLPDGILCQPQHIEEDAPVVSSMQSVGLGGGSAVPGRQYRVDDGTIVFVQTDPQGFVEGQQTSFLAAISGSYTFTDTAGASRTVEKWICVPEESKPTNN